MLQSGWLTHGEYNTKFEQALARRVQAADAVSLNSCTSALELALAVAGIQGEVVVPAFTFVATANAAVTHGARPVFCDVDPESRNMTAVTVERALTARTQAVIVVHFAGLACAMDEIVALCARRNLVLIEDCAEALGAAWRGRPVGSFGFGCFSFFPTKNITTGEGGMLACRAAEEARRARTLAAHGMASSTWDRSRADRPWYRAAEVAGHNYRLAQPLAALGYHQLLRLEELNAKRQHLAERYDSLLAPLAPSIRTPRVSEGATHVYQMYQIRVDAAVRNRIVAQLRGHDIEASVHFDPPVHLHPCYGGRAGDHPVAERLAQELITLPMFPDLAEQDQDWVVEMLTAACREVAHV